jgi:tagatose-1,6-bisphosphate aldolase
MADNQQQQPVTREDLEEFKTEIIEALTQRMRELLDPVALSLLLAPEDDEPETEEERRAVEEARESIRRGDPGKSLDEISRQYGL